MELTQRLELLERLKNYLVENSEEWQEVKARANYANAWFTPEFIEVACNNIIDAFLDSNKLNKFVTQYSIPATQTNPKNVGIVMAGNIPLVGFHDFLCCFLSGHYMTLKLSSKDTILIKHIIKILYSYSIGIQNIVSIAEQLKGCDAYIATGSNNSSRYFDYYFGKYPNIIRKNRTSVAIVTGHETETDLQNLANDIQLYFGQGCRNVTKLYVPEGYDFSKILNALNVFNHFFEMHKYKHNYDYQLALLIMNNKFYMTNGSIILTENRQIFSPISQLNYEYYTNKKVLINELQQNNDIQCIVGEGFIPFGEAQKPSLTNFADGVDTMQFLLQLV